MLLDRPHDVLDILLKSEIQHDISFVQDCEPQLAKIKIFPLHVILDSTCGPNKNIDSTPQFLRLGVNVNTAVDGQHVVLTRVQLE